MTTLAVGSSVTVALRDNGTVAIATNGGFGSVTVTPVGGSASTTSFGPAPIRQIFGPYSEGASVVITNSSCNSLDYDAPPGAALDPAVVQAVGAWPPSYGYTGGKSSASLANTRTALAKAQALLMNANGAGAARGTILCIGDSTVAGTASGTVGQYIRKNAWPAHLARILNQAGYGAISSGFFGGGGTANLNGGDERLAGGAGWSRIGTVFAQEVWEQSAAGGALTWTPDAAVDTVDVYYLTFSGLGTFTVDNGGAAFITQNAATVTTATLAKVSATITSSANPINIKWSAGGAVKIVGVYAYSAASTGLVVVNAGAAGSRTSSWTATGPYSYPALLSYLAPDLTLISLGFNDRQQAVATATYKSNLQSLIATAQQGGTGDVLLLIQHPQKITSHSLSSQKAYWDAANEAAIATGVGVVNLAARWVTGESKAALLADDTHPNAAGGFDIAKAVADVILGQ